MNNYNNVLFLTNIIKFANLLQFFSIILVIIIFAFSIYFIYKKYKNTIQLEKYQKNNISLFQLQDAITEFINAIISLNEIYFYDNIYFDKNNILLKQDIIKNLYLEIEKSYTKISTLEPLINLYNHDSLNYMGVKLLRQYRNLYNLAHTYINCEMETMPILLEEVSDMDLYYDLSNEKDTAHSKEIIETISIKICNLIERKELRAETILKNIKDIEQEKKEMNELAKELRETLIEYIKIYKKVWFERLNS